MCMYIYMSIDANKKMKRTMSRWWLILMADYFFFHLWLYTVMSSIDCHGVKKISHHFFWRVQRLVRGCNSEQVWVEWIGFALNKPIHLSSREANRRESRLEWDWDCIDWKWSSSLIEHIHTGSLRWTLGLIGAWSRKIKTRSHKKLELALVWLWHTYSEWVWMANF